jgi:general secretion pathway protein E
MAADILEPLLAALRAEFKAGRLGAFETAKAFMEGPYEAWAARGADAVRNGPPTLDNLRGAFLDLERASRGTARLLREERRCRRDEVCAAAGLAPIDPHEDNLRDLQEIMNSLIPALSDPGLRQLLELADAPEPGEDSRSVHPAARLAGLLLLDAGRRGASDVAIVPGPWCSLVQYRMGGLMSPIFEISRTYHRALAARFKDMSGLDMSARKRPQEGVSAGDTEGTPRVVIRILATLHGERVDMHLEGPPKSILHPREIGLSSADLKRYESLLAGRCGLVVHAGLAATGKRTALMAAAAELAHCGRSTLAILARHTHDAPGVSVMLAVPGGHDPVVLVREAMRREAGALVVDDLSQAATLKAALEAAAQGSFVLGGLPGDSAVATLRRIFDTGVPLEILRQSLLAICCHRRLRRLCACRVPAAVPTEAKSELGEARLFAPAGCPACLHTGFRGAATVFELLTVGERLKPLLQPGAADKEWTDAAIADGMTPLRASLLALVQEGATSLDEAKRFGL